MIGPTVKRGYKMSNGNCGTHKGCCCGSCSGGQGVHGCGDRGGTVTITAEDGRELKCNIINVFGAKDAEYIALQPIGTNEVVFFRYVEGEAGQAHIENLQSDEEFEQTSRAFMALFEKGVQK